jgi:hypothetical protein
MCAHVKCMCKMQIVLIMICVNFNDEEICKL